MDKRLDHALSKLVEEIDRVETTRKRFGAVMKTIKGHIDLSRFPALVPDTMETSLLKKLEPTSLSGLRIAGIDGGLVRKRFRSMDILLTRAVAVVFQFGREDGPDVEFYPEAFPEPRITPVLLALQSPELDQLASLERVAIELEATISVLDEFHTDLILLTEVSSIIRETVHSVDRLRLRSSRKSWLSTGSSIINPERRKQLWSG